MSRRRTVLPYVPRMVAVGVLLFVAVSALYRYHTGTWSEVFGVVLAGFLILWLAGWAGQEMHELEKEELESEHDLPSQDR